MEPFLGEIRLFAGNFAPYQWALCTGQILPIQQYTALFSLLGTTYGGNGTTNFALPNLQGRTPIHQGTGPGLTPRSLGEADGEATVMLSLPEMAAHTHAAQGSNNSTQSSPGNAFWSGAPGRGAPTYHGSESDRNRGRWSGSQQLLPLPRPQLYYRARGAIPAATVAEP
jgi:microcystin-dependent protein